MAEGDCNAEHPERPELRCSEQAGRPHELHAAFVIGEGWVDWPNPDWREPIGNPRKAIVKMADEVREMRREATKEQRVVRSSSAPPIGGPGSVGHDHPETAKASAAKIDTYSQHAQMLIALAEHGPNHAYGLARYVLAGGEPIPTPRSNSRLKELRDRGYVEKVLDDDGRVVTAETSPGHQGELHRLTPLGASEAARLLRKRS